MTAPVDLTSCDAEPIHVPGAIQPHGLLVALDPRSLRVTHVSDNVQSLLGITVAEVARRGLSAIVPADDPLHAELPELARNGESRPVYQATTHLIGSAESWDAITHHYLNQLFVEFEPAHAPEAQRVALLYRNIQGSIVRMEQSRSVREMAGIAVERVRRLAEFDRVMLYRFDRQWNGEVIAEDRREDLEPFLGLHYPASDIPKQARALYRKNWLRFISDRDYAAAAVVAAPDAAAEPLDMSFAVLRSVSPIHLEYLRNMGVYASMSISILREGELWGLIACHHYSPKFVAYDLRKACELLGHFMSLQITRVESQEAAAGRDRMNARREELVARLADSGDLAAALSGAGLTVLDLFPAGGAAIIDGDAITRLGQTPNEPEIQRLAARIMHSGEEVIAVEQLDDMLPSGLLATVAAGVLAINLARSRAHQVLWFRPEQVRTVNWAGDPRKFAASPDDSHRLSPRGSFALWQETVRGKCIPWSDDEVETARCLREDIVRIMLRRAEQLATAHEDLRLASSERESALAAERSARLESERLNRVKDDFVATLSHELRTPLNAILGWAQLLKMTHSDADDELREGLDIIERNATSQTTMIEDLLEISRIVSGRLRLDLQEVDLASIVETSLDSISPTADAKNIRLERLIDPLFGVKSTGDPNRLRQIVWNLLSNAIKFTPKGGKVQVILRRVQSHLELTVSDTGIGIESAFLPHVFERYRQADPAITRDYGGLGLGLAIVRNLVELHGGIITAASAGRNQGATFTVNLPLRVVVAPDEPDPAQPVSLATTAASAFDLKGLHVLVVDDEADARELIRRTLESANCIVTTASSAADALELQERAQFDLVISDIGMPRQDGYALIAAWRRREASLRIPKTPAIALTAYAQSDDRRKALLAGFNAHLAKPTNVDELATIAASLTDRIGAQGRPPL